MTIIKKQQDKRNVTQLSWWQGEVRIQFSEIQSLHNYPPVYTYKKKLQQPPPTTHIKIKAKIFSHCFSCLLCKCWENVFIGTESKMTAIPTATYHILEKQRNFRVL